jgi:hypothetical protein
MLVEVVLDREWPTARMWSGNILDKKALLTGARSGFALKIG